VALGEHVLARGERGSDHFVMARYLDRDDDDVNFWSRYQLLGAPQG